MNNDLISIVVPIYNVEKYLDRCINSLIHQTYQNIEIILVDDGSTDSSGYLAEQWEIKDNRIKVFRNKNGGLSDARNCGINYAHGKYLNFVDSDDYVDNRFIEILYKTAICTNTKIAAIGFQMFAESETPIICSKIEESNEIFKLEESISYLYNDEKYGNYAWNKLYLRELFDDVKYPVGRKMEDLGTTYLLFDKCDIVSFNSSPLYFYNQRKDSIVHSANRQFWIDRFIMISQRYNYIKDNYPSLYNNYLNYFNEALVEYPYISDENRKNVLNEIIEIWPKVKSNCSAKVKIKYIFIRICPKLYIKVFEK